MKKLSKEIKINGFMYKQVVRLKSHAIYEQYFSDDINPIAFEVIQIKVRGSKEFKGKLIAPYEAMPSTSDWGTYGWTYWTLEKAKEKLRQLCVPLV